MTTTTGDVGLSRFDCVVLGSPTPWKHRTRVRGVHDREGRFLGVFTKQKYIL